MKTFSYLLLVVFPLLTSYTLDTGQKIPSPPCLPCDLFTSCLTTPLHMSIRWYSSVLMFFRLPGKTFYQDKQHVYDDIFAFIPGDIVFFSLSCCLCVETKGHTSWKTPVDLGLDHRYNCLGLY